MILGDDGKKLSKRHGATAVGDYQDKGILPAAMRNFLALLGWSPGGDREIMSEAELIEAFSLEGIQKKPAVFDTAKLEWMNGQYLSVRSADELLEPTERELARMGVATGGRDLKPFIDSVKARSRTILNIAEQVAVRLDASRVVRDEKGEKLAAKLGPAFGGNLSLVASALEGIPAAEWNSERILADVKALAEAQGAKLGDLLQPVRVVLTGSTVSEPVNDLLVVMGREPSLARLRNAADR
jgi:glutamyl-tRNA synthetase